MAKIPSIDDLNTKQLRTLIETAHLRIKEIEEEELQATRAKLQELVEQSGFDMQRLFPNFQRSSGGRGRPKGNGGERTPAKPKYRSLRDPSLTWTGKGRLSSWLVAEMEETGKPREAFLIA